VPPAAASIVKGVVNIDPLTTLIAYDAAGLVAGSKLPANNDQVLALLPKVTAAQYQKALSDVMVAALLQVLQAGYSVPATGFDPTTAAFTADGQGVDAFFDAYPLATTGSSVAITAPSAPGPLVQVTLPATAGTHSIVTSTTAYSIGGAASGLAGGAVTLLNNGADPLTVTQNGTFTFSHAVSSSYTVTVGAQPTGRTCTVSNGTGAGITADVSNISVACSALAYRIGGTVAGLASGAQLTLEDNASDPATVSGNGAFTFATPVAYDGGYSVTVSSQPIGQVCTVSNASGAGVTANISTVSIACSATTFTIAGSVIGLANGTQVTLDDNGADPAFVTANTAFTFATPVAYDGSYAITVGTQPTGQTCTVSNASGAGVTGNIANVLVTCSAVTYTIGGSVSGLATGAQVTLDDNGANPIVVSANGPFTFATPVAYSGSFAVTVGTQPTGQVCTVVAHASGSGVTSAVSNVQVTCSTVTYTIGGSVTGLANGTQVTLDDNGADPAIVTANGSFTFATPVAYNGSYTVTVGTQPTAQTCTVSNGSGTGVIANVSAVAVSCAAAVPSFYVYVPNYGSGNVLAYEIDPLTGAESYVSGGPFAAGTQDRWVATNPAGTFAYATNQNSNNVSAYSVDPTTGALTAVAGSPFATGTTPISMTINPAGTFAYVANANSASVSAYTIDGTTGALMPIAGSPFATGSDPTKIAIHPAGTFAYVTNQGDETISTFAIDPGTGALTPVGSPVATGGSPRSITVNAAGTFVYSANWEASLNAYSIDPVTGALTTVGGSPFTSSYTGWGWQDVEINPAGTFAYAATGNGGPLQIFSVDSTSGALTATGDPYSPNGYNFGYDYIKFNSAGTFAYVSNSYILTVSVCNVDPTTGALTDVPGSPFNVDARPFDIAVVPHY
jgi:6-phosphogluconolactonase (cycloisomerase 2 family)